MPLMTMAWGSIKFGFEQEGVMRDYAFRDGQYVDAIMMSRINKNRG